MGVKKCQAPFGFSLTELMLVVGLFGLVMLGSMRLFQDAFKTQTKVEAGQDAIMLTDQLSRILSDAATCTTLFKGTLSENATPLVLGKGLYVGAQLGRIRVADLRLRDVTELADNVLLAKVELRGENANGESGGQFARELPVVYRTNEAGYIIECLGDNFGVAGNCKTLGGKWDETKRRCDFCPALGGESNARGRCQLIGTPIAHCPMQKAFSANSLGGECGSNWDSDFIGDSVRYLGTFGHVSSETVGWYKQDLQKHLDTPLENDVPKKSLGGRSEASWLITTEPPNDVTQKPCNTLVYLTVKCP